MLDHIRNFWDESVLNKVLCIAAPITVCALIVTSIITMTS